MNKLALPTLEQVEAVVLTDSRFIHPNTTCGLQIEGILGQAKFLLESTNVPVLGMASIAENDLRASEFSHSDWLTSRAAFAICLASIVNQNEAKIGSSLP